MFLISVVDADSENVDLTGVTRLDQESTGTHGWQVRIQRRGVRFGRFFSDVESGSKKEALEKAIRYRDRIIAHDARVSSQGTIRSHQNVGARNKSGVIGVTRISQKNSNGVEYHFWQASWTDEEGNRQSVRYSVLKLGESKAFELACIAREEGLKS